MAKKRVQRPHVFISYSHDSDIHRARTLELANWLRENGIDAVVDQYYEDNPPADDWPTWMLHGIQNADFVLVICTKPYQQRFERRDRRGRGKGVKWEGAIITMAIYEAEYRNRKFVPVVFEAKNTKYRPTILSGTTYYDLSDDNRKKSLLRRIFREPLVIPPDIGRKPSFSEDATPSPEKNVKVFDVPFRRNQYFTGRDEILRSLHSAISSGNAAALSQAVSGLGGVGKTQIAVEYAYRHEEEYRHVFWVQADNASHVATGYAEIARRLQLIANGLNDPDAANRAVQYWMDHNDGWLLVLDNADTPQEIAQFVPKRPKGHILVTSKERVFDCIGIPRAFEVPVLPDNEGIAFLLKRIGRERYTSDELSAAKELVCEFGCFPLALEQAGAYIKTRKTTIQSYLKSYRTRGVGVLDLQLPEIGGYAKSVTTTWEMNFEQVEQWSPASADLLRFLAFLAPEGLPLKLVAEGGGELGPILSAALSSVESDPLKLEELIAPPARYSLIRRDDDIITIHRLVQYVIVKRLTDDARKEWIFRAIRTINKTLQDVNVSNWAWYDQLYPHARLLIQAIEKDMIELREATRLVNQYACWLRNRGEYPEAERLYQLALKLSQSSTILVPEETATILGNLGTVYSAQWRYGEARTACMASLKIRLSYLPKDHPLIAFCLHNISGIDARQAEYKSAERFIRRALEIRRTALGDDHPHTLESMNDLGSILFETGRYAEAMDIHRRVLEKRMKILGIIHPETSTSIANLAGVMQMVGCYEEAGKLYRRALEIDKAVYGEIHPEVAWCLQSVAMEELRANNVQKAIDLFLDAISVAKKSVGDSHPMVSVISMNLAMAYRADGRHEEAIALCLDGLTDLENALGSEHPQFASAFNSYINLLMDEGSYEQAEPLARRSLSIHEKSLGSTHPTVATCMQNLAICLGEQDRLDDAATLHAKALHIVEKTYGPYHPQVALCHENYAIMLRHRNRISEAVVMENDVVAIRRKHEERERRVREGLPPENEQSPAPPTS